MREMEEETLEEKGTTMGSEANPPSPSSSSSATVPAVASPSPLAPASPSRVASPSTTKRSRDPEDDVYVDNLHSHKRYLSEIMASSLNGLTVGDALPENIMESPARSDSMFYPSCRDEMSLQYSPMSEDLDDCLYYETSANTYSSQPDSLPTSPVSPYRHQKFPSIFSSGPTTTSHPFHGCTHPAISTSQSRQRGGSDSEGRFPSSPSDICHSADLRRAALLRSVQMRTQPLGPAQFEGSFSPMQDSVHNLVDEREYHIEEVCTSMSISGPEEREKSCRVLDMNLKVDESS